MATTPTRKGREGPATPAVRAAPGPRPWVAEPVLAAEHLSVAYGGTPAVQDVSFALRPAQTLGVVGESGAGKTTLALAVMGLLPRHASVEGAVRFAGATANLLDLGERALAGIRGRGIALIPQEPGAALNPVLTVGAQVAEAVRAHRRGSRREARERAEVLLQEVGVPATRLRCYPHELSGGQRQRALIAMAMAGAPRVFVADEPTAALDATVQAQVLDTLAAARARTRAALLLITHDLTVVAGHADRVLVMYAGRVVESATVDALFEHARMPYTLTLLAAAREIGAPPAQPLSTGASPGGHGSPDSPPAAAGCAFAHRCPLATQVCHQQVPALRPIGRHAHLAACHHAEETR